MVNCVQRRSEVKVGGTEEYSDAEHAVKLVHSASEVRDADLDMKCVPIPHIVTAEQVESDVRVGATDWN